VCGFDDGVFGFGGAATSGRRMADFGATPAGLIEKDRISCAAL
jgi:hypothetical protein